MLAERPGARKRDPWYIPRMSPLAAQDAEARLTKAASARASDITQSVKKLNVVAKLVRRLHVDDAIIQLSLLNKRKAARAILKVSCCTYCMSLAPGMCCACELSYTYTHAGMLSFSLCASRGFAQPCEGATVCTPAWTMESANADSLSCMCAAHPDGASHSARQGLGS